MMELRYGSCYPKALLGVNVALACIDAAISAFAFYQVRSVPILAINTLVDGYMFVFSANVAGECMYIYALVTF